MSEDALYLSKCAECGKRYIKYDSGRWAYKIFCGNKVRYYCSYHCMRQVQKRKEEAGKK